MEEYLTGKDAMSLLRQKSGDWFPFLASYSGQ